MQNDHAPQFMYVSIIQNFMSLTIHLTILLSYITTKKNNAVRGVK